MSTTTVTTLVTPIGTLRLVADDEHLVGLWVEEHERTPALEPDHVVVDRAQPVLAESRTQLAEYFAGERTSFDLPLAPQGTPFQLEVWAALREIPYGETASYADIARAVGRPTGFRAVGAANGRNPLSIIVPCHRVIGADGQLTGYGWGVERKAWLLDHERNRAR